MERHRHRVGDREREIRRELERQMRERWRNRDMEIASKRERY